MRRGGADPAGALALLGSAILAACLLSGCTTLVEPDGALAPVPSTEGSGAEATSSPRPREAFPTPVLLADRELSLPVYGPAERSLISEGSRSGVVDHEQSLSFTAMPKKGELLVQVDCVGAEGELGVDIVNVGSFSMACGVDAPLINQLTHVAQDTELVTRLHVPPGAHWVVDVLETDNPLRAAFDG